MSDLRDEMRDAIDELHATNQRWVPFWSEPLAAVCAEVAERHLQQQREEVEAVLALAHDAVTWAHQCSEGIAKSGGGKHWPPKYRAYMEARFHWLLSHGVGLTTLDVGGCTCDPHAPDFERCLYHRAAKAQPDNHRIPWNCPTYYDGCNCAEVSGG